MNRSFATPIWGLFFAPRRPIERIKVPAGLINAERIDHQYLLDPWSAPDSHLPKKREWPDGPNKQFLQNLQRPDNHKHPYRDKNSQSCCDAGDTVKTRFKVEPAQGGPHPEDRWYAWIKDEWKPVPPDRIIPDYAPDGQAYLFMLSDVIVCFVRPKGGL